MALKFQLRGSSINAWYATAFKTGESVMGTPTVISDSTSGVFGGEAIQMSGASALGFQAGENWATGVAGFTVLMRIVPSWNGTPSNTQQLLSIGDPSGSYCHGLNVFISNGEFIKVHSSNGNGTPCYSDQLYGGGPGGAAWPTFVAGQPIDLWFRWTGNNGDPFELFTAANGATPTQLTSGGGNNAYEAGDTRGKFLATSMRLGINNGVDAFSSDFEIVEVSIWDSFEDPTAYGVRSDFVAAPNFEGYSFTDPGVSNVASGVEYVFGGVNETGTLVSPTSTDPGETNVLDGINYEIAGVSKTGTYVAPVSTDPGVANVRDGTTYEINNAAKTGTLIVPGTSTDPGESNVLSGVSYEIEGASREGTYTPPASSDPGVTNVLDGVDYEISGVSKVGTYTPPTSTDPGVANVVDGIEYEINNVPKVGTFESTSTDPGASNVRRGVPYEINGSSLIGSYSLYDVTTTPEAGVIDASLQALVTFISTQVPAITVLDEWPDANQALKYPSITITSGKQKRTPLMPEQLSITTPNDLNQVTVTETVAMYDSSFQLDLWTRNKIEREKYLAAILALFNAAEISTNGPDMPDGITLTLTSYFNSTVRFEIDSHENKDDEGAAERRERRCMITVLVNCREIRQRVAYAMRSIKTYSQFTSSPDDLTDDLSGTEEFDLPTD